MSEAGRPHRFPKHSRSILTPHARAQRQCLSAFSYDRPCQVTQLVVPAWDVPLVMKAMLKRFKHSWEEQGPPITDRMSENQSCR